MSAFSKTGIKLFALILLFYPATLFSQNPDIRILRSINSSEKLPSDRLFQFISNSDAWLVVGIPVAAGPFALATSLSLSYPKWYIIVPSYAWAGSVGYSRMDLGVHYPSDVLAGAVIGAGSAWLTYYINKKLIIKSHPKR